MAICEQSIQGNSPTSTCFAADFLAKVSRLRDGVSVSEIQEELSSLKLPESLQKNGLHFYSWKMSSVCYRMTAAGRLINCVGQAYDFESERFLVSILKHEAQHTVDMKRFPGITPAELEYRAKLVELHYSGDISLLQKFISEADEGKTGDSHAVASARIRREFADTDQTELPRIRTRALELLRAHTDEMKEKYEKAVTDDRAQPSSAQM